MERLFVEEVPPVGSERAAGGHPPTRGPASAGARGSGAAVHLAAGSPERPPLSTWCWVGMLEPLLPHIGYERCVIPDVARGLPEPQRAVPLALFRRAAITCIHNASCSRSGMPAALAQALLPAGALHELERVYASSILGGHARAQRAAVQQAACRACEVLRAAEFLLFGDASYEEQDLKDEQQALRADPSRILSAQLLGGA